jgi:hypothetical protein
LRGIIDDDNFIVCVVLGEDGVEVELCPKIVDVVIGWNHNANTFLNGKFI